MGSAPQRLSPHCLPVSSGRFLDCPSLLGKGFAGPRWLDVLEGLAAGGGAGRSHPKPGRFFRVLRKTAPPTATETDAPKSSRKPQ